MRECRKGQSNGYGKEILTEAAGHELRIGQQQGKCSRVLILLTVLQLDIKKKENVAPNSFYFCTR